MGVVFLIFKFEYYKGLVSELVSVFAGQRVQIFMHT
jgi:hypothetical protein